MPRPQNLDPSVEISIQLPLTLVAELDFILWDFIRGKPAYGERTKLAEQLFRSYISRYSARGTKPMSDRPLPDPSTMDENARIAYINDARRRVVAGEEISDAELRLSIEMIRMSRANAGKRKSSGKQPAAAGPNLADLLQQAGVGTPGAAQAPQQAQGSQSLGDLLKGAGVGGNDAES